MLARNLRNPILKYPNEYCLNLQAEGLAAAVVDLSMTEMHSVNEETQSLVQVY